MDWLLFTLDQMLTNGFIILGIVMLYHLIVMKILRYYENKGTKIDYTLGVLNGVSIAYFCGLSFVFQLTSIDASRDATILTFTLLMVAYVTLYLGFKGGVLVLIAGVTGKLVSSGYSPRMVIFWFCLLITIAALWLMFLLTNRPNNRLLKNWLGIQFVVAIFYFLVSTKLIGVQIVNSPVRLWATFSVFSLGLGFVLQILASENDYVARVAYGAATDGVTKLKNYSEYNLRLEENFSLPASERVPLTLAEIDIDHFKLINDSHGHPAGTGLLKKFAEVLTEEAQLIPGTEAFRVGGEEFALVIPDVNSLVAKSLVGRLQRRWEQVQKDDLKLANRTTLSVGISCMKSTDQNYQDVYQRADQALYQAKQSGRNQIVIK